MTQTMTNKTKNKILQVFHDLQELALLDKSQNLIKSYQQLSLPINEYTVCITPRSGSSWLTEILSKTKILGSPEEWLNPGNLPGIIQNRYPCLDVIEYFDCIKRTQCVRMCAVPCHRSTVDIRGRLKPTSSGHGPRTVLVNTLRRRRPKMRTNPHQVAAAELPRAARRAAPSCSV